MPYTPHILVQFSGTFESESDEVEIWSIGFRCIATADAAPSTPLTATVADQEDYADHLETVSLPLLNNVSSLNVAGQAVKIDLIKANAIGADGKYVNDTTTLREVAASMGGANTTAIYPTQVSKVLTLETAKNRGLGHRGRVYVPSPTNPMTGLSRFAVTTTELEAWAAFVGSLEYSANGGIFTVSPAVVSGSGDPSLNWNRITAVSMDNRFDIQRRRANAIVGTRTTQPLP